MDPISAAQDTAFLAMATTYCTTGGPIDTSYAQLVPQTQCGAGWNPTDPGNLPTVKCESTSAAIAAIQTALAAANARPLVSQEQLRHNLTAYVESVCGNPTGIAAAVRSYVPSWCASNGITADVLSSTDGPTLCALTAIPYLQKNNLIALDGGKGRVGATNAPLFMSPAPVPAPPPGKPTPGNFAPGSVQPWTPPPPPPDSSSTDGGVPLWVMIVMPIMGAALLAFIIALGIEVTKRKQLQSAFSGSNV